MRRLDWKDMRAGEFDALDPARSIAILPLANGVMVVNREFPQVTPSGMSFGELASVTGGGAHGGFNLHCNAGALFAFNSQAGDILGFIGRFKIDVPALGALGHQVKDRVLIQFAVDFQGKFKSGIRWPADDRIGCRQLYPFGFL